MTGENPLIRAANAEAEAAASFEDARVKVGVMLKTIVAVYGLNPQLAEVMTLDMINGAITFGRELERKEGGK